MGTTSLQTQDIQVLRNDGSGTPEPTLNVTSTLHLESQAVGGFIPPVDKVPPEPFSVYLSLLANDKYYAVFSAVDKGSGIDHYEIAEKRFPFQSLLWTPAQSPYLLRDQYLTSDVYIKAIDHAGNAYISVLHHVHLFRLYEILIGILAIVLPFFALVYFFLRRTHHV